MLYTVTEIAKLRNRDVSSVYKRIKRMGLAPVKFEAVDGHNVAYYDWPLTGQVPLSGDGKAFLRGNRWPDTELYIAKSGFCEVTLQYARPLPSTRKQAPRSVRILWA
jgi:hypothetical protein